jgi:Holliday junction resolvase RusA-like endonuclease
MSKSFGVYDSQKHQKLAFGITVKNQHSNDPVFTKSISIDVVYYHDIIKVAAKKRVMAFDKYHKQTPDLDNLIKFTLDASNKVIIHDDCLVGKITAEKRYSDVPRTEFTITELE